MGRGVGEDRSARAEAARRGVRAGGVEHAPQDSALRLGEPRFGRLDHPESTGRLDHPRHSVVPQRRARVPQPPSVIGEPLELRHRQVQHPRDRRDVGQGETGHVDGSAGVQGLDDAHRVERRHERRRPRPPHVPVDDLDRRLRVAGEERLDHRSHQLVRDGAADERGDRLGRPHLLREEDDAIGDGMSPRPRHAPGDLDHRHARDANAARVTWNKAPERRVVRGAHAPAWDAGCNCAVPPAVTAGTDLADPTSPERRRMNPDCHTSQSGCTAPDALRTAR